MSVGAPVRTRPPEAPETGADGPSGPGGEADGLRRLLLNAVSLLGAYVIPRICTFAAVVVAARVLGVETFGFYGTAAALAVMLSIVATLGMMQLLVREMAREPARAPELMGAAHAAKGVSVLVMLAALAALVAGPLGYPDHVVAAALLLGAGYGVGAYVENLGAWFQAVERMEVWMQAQALFGIVTGVGGVALVLGTESVVWFCVAPILGQAVALAWLVRRAPPSVRGAWRTSWAAVTRLARALAPFAAAVVVLTAYTKVDVLLVERLRGAAEAGIYAAAFKFVDIVQALAFVAATAIYPRLSRMAGGAGGPEQAGRAAGRTADLLLLAAVPGAALLWLLREPVVTLLFGADYGASARVLAFLAPALPALALNILGSTVLAASKRMALVATLYGGGLLLRVGLDLALVPRFGAEGAGAAVLVAETTLLAGMLLALRSRTGATVAPRAAVAGVSGLGVAGIVGLAGWPSSWAVPVFCGATVAIYGLLRVVPAREWGLLREAVGR